MNEPKMIVVRPNCFVSTIYTLRELGIELLDLKNLLEKEQSKTIDIKNFRVISIIKNIFSIKIGP